MALAGVSKHAVAIHAVRAVADVADVDEPDAFCASVYWDAGVTPVVRLATWLRGSPHEGDALRWAMIGATGAYGVGLFVYLRVDGGITG